MKKYTPFYLLPLIVAWLIPPTLAIENTASYQQRYQTWAQAISETNEELSKLSYWNWSSSSKKKELLQEQGSNYLEFAKIHLEDAYDLLQPVLQGNHAACGMHDLNTLRNRFMQTASNLSSAQHQYKQIGGGMNKHVAEILQHTEEIADLILNNLSDIETIDGFVLSNDAAKLLEPEWAYQEAEWLAKFIEGIQNGIDRAERELYEHNSSS